MRVDRPRSNHCRRHPGGAAPRPGAGLMSVPVFCRPNRPPSISARSYPAFSNGCGRRSLAHCVASGQDAVDRRAGTGCCSNGRGGLASEAGHNMFMLLPAARDHRARPRVAPALAPVAAVLNTDCPGVGCAAGDPPASPPGGHRRTGWARRSRPRPIPRPDTGPR